MADEGLIETGRARAFNKAGGVPRVTVLKIVDADDSGHIFGTPEQWEADTPAPKLRIIEKERKGALGIGDRVLARTEERGDKFVAHPLKKLAKSQELVLGVLRRNGLAVEQTDLARAEPLAWQQVRHLMPFERYGQEESRAFWAQFYRALLAALGRADDPELRDQLYVEFQRLENWRLYPDAIPVLGELRARGYRLGVVSNWEEWLEDLLLALEVHHLFEVIVASGPFGRAKPHPSIFRRALDLAGVAPSEAVHVGDSPREDIEGARSAGLRPILIDRRGRYPDLDVERIVSLSELLGVLRTEG
jgi:REG-2-like HAD superfamily hydrolase